MGLWGPLSANGRARGPVASLAGRVGLVWLPALSPHDGRQDSLMNFRGSAAGRFPYMDAATTGTSTCIPCDHPLTGRPRKTSNCKSQPQSSREPQSSGRAEALARSPPGVTAPRGLRIRLGPFASPFMTLLTQPVSVFTRGMGFVTVSSVRRLRTLKVSGRLKLEILRMHLKLNVSWRLSPGKKPA
jgi:hypothetical protein